MAIENSYTRDGETYATSNIPIKITAGDTDSKMTFKYGSLTGAYEQIFFRGSTQDTGTTMQLDVNLGFDLTGGDLSGDGIFNIGTWNTIIIGSQEYKRTLTISAGVGQVQNLFLVNENSSVVMYSDVLVNGNMLDYLYRGQGSFTIEGDTEVDFSGMSSSGYFSIVTLSGGSSSYKGSAVVNGDIVVKSLGTSTNADLILLNKDGNKLDVSGNASIYGVTAKGTGSYVVLNNTNQTAKITGDITLDYTEGSTVRLLWLRNYHNVVTEDMNQSLVVDGNLIVKHSGKEDGTNSQGTSFFFLDSAVGGQSIVMNGDISMENVTRYTSLFEFSSNSAGYSKN